MRLVLDIEADGITNPKNIWLVVCKDIDTGEYHIFREVTKHEKVKEDLKLLLDNASLLIGHHILGYDLLVIQALLQIKVNLDIVIDTLVVSKMFDYSREAGHSLEEYGEELGKEKLDYTDFTKYTKEMEVYCVRDVDITHLVYDKYHNYISNYLVPIQTEQRFQWLVVNDLHHNGFSFNVKKAQELLEKVHDELKRLDTEITSSFPERAVHTEVITPRRTRHGTLHKGDFRWLKSNDLSEFNGGPFCRLEFYQFNPASHRQIIEVLHDSSWSPIDKTTTHIETERAINRIKFRPRDSELDITLQSLILKLDGLKKYGWKVNETNLSTLPNTAPAPARTLAKRILFESRRRTLTEWLGLVNPDTERIHGSFYGIGAWSQRMAHQAPNTANIPNSTKEDGSIKLLGKELRSLWQAPPGRLLVGVDAEGIQLRVFAHLIDDKQFTQAIIDGRKDTKTDPHSLNAFIIQCTRQQAKKFIYALLLGAGIGKLSQILERSKEETTEALNRLLRRYEGFSYLKREVIPTDAQRGYFIGLDGRRVPIPGTLGERKHLAMSGYLQNGESVIMKLATLKWYEEVKSLDGILVNFVHDEWQTECPHDMEVALEIARIQSNSLEEVGKDLKLKCPLAGSYENDHGITIGKNWYITH